MTAFFINLLNWINGVVGNYGWSIVLFTLLIRMVLLPLDIKSKKSMRAMNKIQPKVQALQKKYANDKEKLNQKTMELYRKEHVSPTAGCLPMLISLPILWIMFSAMRTVGNEKTIEMILHMKNTGTLPDLPVKVHLGIADVLERLLLQLQIGAVDGHAAILHLFQNVSDIPVHMYPFHGDFSPYSGEAPALFMSLDV